MAFHGWNCVMQFGLYPDNAVGHSLLELQLPTWSTEEQIILTSKASAGCTETWALRLGLHDDTGQR